jgi:hypothetical protein
VSHDVNNEEHLRYMVDYCKDFTGRLNPWELDFIESISERLEGGGTLTEAQADKLEQIYCKMP